MARYPYIALLSGSNERTKKVASSEGFATPGAIMQLLLPAVDQHGAQFVADRADHNETVSAAVVCTPRSCLQLDLTAAAWCGLSWRVDCLLTIQRSFGGWAGMAIGTQCSLLSAWDLQRASRKIVPYHAAATVSCKWYAPCCWDMRQTMAKAMIKFAPLELEVGRQWVWRAMLHPLSIATVTPAQHPGSADRKHVASCLCTA